MNQFQMFIFMKRIEFWQKCDTKSLEILLSKTKDIATFRNIQAVYLKAKYNMSAESVAQVIQFPSLINFLGEIFLRIKFRRKAACT